MYNRAIYTHINVGICTHTGSHCFQLRGEVKWNTGKFLSDYAKACPRKLTYSGSENLKSQDSTGDRPFLLRFLNKHVIKSKGEISIL